VLHQAIPTGSVSKQQIGAKASGSHMGHIVAVPPVATAEQDCLVSHLIDCTHQAMHVNEKQGN
jgi:hypothetical protein